MSTKAQQKAPGAIAVNKQARRNYEFLETVEAGIALVGSEVKSLRAGRVSFKDGHVRFKADGAWLIGVHIAPWEHTGVREAPDPERPRRLLLHKGEIAKLAAQVEQKGLSVIPAKMYFTRGKVKVQLALGRGKKTHDKRQDIKQRDIDRDTQRQLAKY